MGYGLPVIAFSSGGLKETMHDDINGYLFQEQTEKSVGDAIEKLQSLSSEKYVEMRKSSRNESEKYSEAVFKSKITQLVNSLTR